MVRKPPRPLSSPRQAKPLRFVGLNGISAEPVGLDVLFVQPSSPLEDDLGGWFSYHYQLRRSQGERAVMRVVFQPVESGIRVKGFGHRFKPADVYHRMVMGKR